MHKRLFSLRDAAAILGKQPYQITYQLTTGRVPEPGRVGGKRVFTIDDLNQLAERLGIKKIMFNEKGK